jgi:hypothetical protein
MQYSGLKWQYRDKWWTFVIAGSITARTYSDEISTAAGRVAVFHSNYLCNK